MTTKNDQSALKAQAKKENQRLAGEKSQQRGENVKNKFTSVVSWVSDESIELNKLRKVILDCYDIKPENVSRINSKAFSDGGSEKSVKPDNKTTIKLKDDSKIECLISIKSTFGSTQLAIHSLNSLKNYMETNYNITLPDEVYIFLSLFTNSNHAHLGLNSSPIHNAEYHEINECRQRFAVDDIDTFDTKYSSSFKEFIKNNARSILTFLLAKGSAKSDKLKANAICFVGNNFQDILIYQIEYLIDKAITQCNKDGSWVTYGRQKKKSGVTTIDLFGGLVTLQMKGSGEGSAYHYLQFRISGNRVAKLLKNWSEV